MTMSEPSSAQATLPPGSEFVDIEEKSFGDTNEFTVSLDLPDYKLPHRAALVAWSSETHIVNVTSVKS
jgi:hypothetical protein